VPRRAARRRGPARGAAGPAMTALRVTINGAGVADERAPRTSLADYLRERRTLPGAHLGCEHGVCGPCTVLIDGEPARAYPTLPGVCDGREIRTIEDFARDGIMTAL